MGAFGASSSTPGGSVGGTDRSSPVVTLVSVGFLYLIKFLFILLDIPARP